MRFYKYLQPEIIKAREELLNISKTHQNSIDNFMNKNNFVYAEREFGNGDFDYFFVSTVMQEIQDGETLEYDIGMRIEKALSEYEFRNAYAYKIIKNEDNQVVRIQLLEVVGNKPMSKITKSLIFSLYCNLDEIEIELDLFILEKGQKEALYVYPISLRECEEDKTEDTIETPF